MASTVLTNAYVLWGTGTNLSAYTRSVTLNYEAESLDDTLMGDDTRSHIGGLKSWSAEVELYEDTSSTVTAALFSDVGTVKNLAIRASATGKSASNPEYAGDALLVSMPPFGQGVGEINSITVSFENAGTLSRATS